MAGVGYPGSPLPPSALKEQNLSNQENEHLDLDELISSLPKDRGSVGPALMLYRNFWCPSNVFPGFHSFCCRFVAVHSDIILASWPKSGTTWLKALAFSALHRNVFPPSTSNHPLISSNPHDLVPFLEFTVYGPDSELHDVDSFPAPRLFATHCPYNSLPESIRRSSSRVIYICRNPLDTIVSHYNFRANVSPELIWRGQCSMEEIVDYYSKGIMPFGPFWEHMLGYWKATLERPEKVLFLKYEDLKEDTVENLKKIAEFMRVPFSDGEERDGLAEEIVKLCSLNSLKEMEVIKTGKRPFPLFVPNKSFFKKGDVGDWANHLTPSMVKKLETVMEEKLNPYGLKFRVK